MQWYTNHLRQTAKERRAEFWRLVDTIDELAPGTDQYIQAVGALHATILNWRQTLSSFVASAGERPDVKALWEPIETFREDSDPFEIGDPKKAISAGQRLNNLTVILLDTPHRAPVVEELWQPGDICSRSLDDFLPPKEVRPDGV